MEKNHSKSFKWLKKALPVAGFLACCGLLTAQNASKPMRLKEVTYIFSGTGFYEGFTDVSSSPMAAYTSPRIIYAMNDSMAQIMKRSLLKAMNSYWEAGFELDGLEVTRSSSMLREFPKFKPKVAKGSSDYWEVFIRISDRVAFPWMPEAGAMTENATNLLLECKVLNGADGKETFSRSMQVGIKRTPPPPGSYLLEKVPGMPQSYLHAFDSAVRVFFSSGPPATLGLEIEPACLFVSDSLSRQIRRLIRFTAEGNTVRVIDGPEMSWAPGKMDMEKSGKTKREGAGVLGGILTATTGISSSGEKSKTTNYISRIPVTDPVENKTYTFHIPVTEKEVQTIERNRERGSGTVHTETTDRSSNRYTNGPGYLTLEADTIATYQFFTGQPDKGEDVFNRCWNGVDSATIMPMPKSWNNDDLYNPLSVEGTLYEKPFRFSNHKAGNQLDIYYDAKHVATLRVNNGRPTDGILYNADVPAHVLKALAMFTTLPYGFYGL